MLLRFCIFTIITLNSFSGSLPIFSLYILPCEFLFFIGIVFLCLFILSVLGFLSPGYGVIVPLAFGLCPWWIRLVRGLCRLHVGRDLCSCSGGRGWVFPSDGQGCLRWCVLGCLWAASLLMFMFLSCLLFGRGVQRWVLQAVGGCWVLGSGGGLRRSAHRLILPGVRSSQVV